MKVRSKGYYQPAVFSLFGTFLSYMVVRDLHTGEIWRGGSEATITLANDAGHFYFVICFLSAMALTFWASAILALFLRFRPAIK